MEFEMKMPDLATTGSAMMLIRWLAKPGEPVQRGQKLLEVETEKAAVEVESTATGILRETRFSPGDLVCAGDIIAIIETAEAAMPTPPTALTVGPTVPAAQSPAPTSKKTGGMFARNRQAAAKTVPRGVVSTKSVTGIPLSLARRAVGRRLQHSKQTIPHFYLQTSANAGVMIARRKAAWPEKLAWEAFFVYAAGRMLANFEQLTCRFENETLLPANASAIGVAVDIEGDLFLISVGAPAQKTIEAISSEIHAAAAALRRNEPGSRKSQSGCFTITNLGAANIETFTAIVNPPEAAILAIGKIHPVVMPRGEAGFSVEQRVNLTLSVDHRVVSGKYAADFLSAVVAEIEHL
jgi:pyruvate dehydrogenase E2 component (dihydrolipoamide acetyltransferase)